MVGVQQTRTEGTMKRPSRIILWELVGAAAFYCDVPASRGAETGVTIEAVDKYSCGALSQNKPNVDNFRTRMLSISGYTAGVRFTDGLVFPTDFTDPQKVSGGADTSNFDRPGDAIAYFSGHGICDDQTGTSCTSNASCPNVAGVQKRRLRFTDNPLQGHETAEAYAKTAVAADFKEPGDADVIEKVQTDLAGKNITVTEAELRAELTRAGAEARRQLSES
jgi:hypothetical protein